MKLLTCVFLATLTLFAEAPVQFVHYTTTTSEDAPATEVQVYIPDTASKVFRVRIEYTNEAGRTLRASKLVDLTERKVTGLALISVTFETGVATVKRVTVEELGVQKTHSQTY